MLTRELLAAIDALRKAASAIVAGADLWRTQLESMVRTDASSLRGQLDAGAADAAECAFRTWIAIVDFALAAGAVATDRMPSEVEDYLATEPSSPIRLQAVLMAVMESLRTGSPDVTADLAYLAFDVARSVLNGLRAAGLNLDPFRGETVAERAARIRRYAANLRHTLDDDDVEIMESGRVGQLR